MDSSKIYLKKLKELKDTEKSKKVITLIEAMTNETPENEEREAIESAKDLIEAERTANDTREELRIALKGKNGDEYGPYLMDYSGEFVYYERDGDTKIYRADYSRDEFDKIVIGSSTEVKIETNYVPVVEAKKQLDLFDNKNPLLQGDFIQLSEASIGDDGTIPIKIIEPGWGSSGYYPAEVLERDAGIYKEGTKMYWDHPTVSDEIERPERSLNDLAGVLVSEGYYDNEGSQGPGVYAKAKVFSQFQENIEEMAPYIGVSHVALGKATVGEVDGKSGALIESLNVAESVDFVTSEGAGGKILQLFESARNIKPKKMEGKNDELAQLKESLNKANEQNQRLKEKALLGDAKNLVAEELKEADLPDVTKARLQESLSKNPIVDEKGDMDKVKYVESIKKAITEEQEYLGKLSESGKIKGMGESADASQKEEDVKVTESLKESFEGLGLSEEAVNIAIKGR